MTQAFEFYETHHDKVALRRLMASLKKYQSFTEFFKEEVDMILDGTDLIDNSFEQCIEDTHFNTKEIQLFIAK